MVEVVINTCFGGFGLSPEALLELVKRGCRCIEKIRIEEYAGEYADDLLNEFEEFREGYMKHRVLDILYRDGYVYRFRYHDDECRADKDLVAVVKKLGAKAYGEHAKLKIVKVPDDVEWEIEEYDGAEWISEKHRRWE